MVGSGLASEPGMSFCIGFEPRTGSVVFEGLMTREALDQVLVHCKAAGTHRLLLRRGTEATPECVEYLALLDFEIRCETPFLAHWLASAQGDRGTR